MGGINFLAREASFLTWALGFAQYAVVLYAGPLHTQDARRERSLRQLFTQEINQGRKTKTRLRKALGLASWLELTA